MSFERSNDFRVGEPELATRSEPPTDSSSCGRHQAESGPGASTSTSQGTILPPTNAAKAATFGQSITRDGKEMAEASTTVTSDAVPQRKTTMPGVPLYRFPEGAAGRGNVLPVRLDQPINGPPRAAPAYHYDPRFGGCMAWDGDASAGLDDGSFSNDPRADFGVPHLPRDPVSSTAGPSDHPEDSFSYTIAQ